MAGEVVAVDHVGYVVTDLDAAVRFFVEVLGFADANRRGEWRSDDDLLTRLFGVEPRAEARYAFVKIGDDLVELLEWTAPDRATDIPKNSDPGGRHLALAVTGLDALVERLAAQPGVTVRELSERGFRYVSTPFGLDIQLSPR